MSVLWLLALMAPAQAVTIYLPPGGNLCGALSGAAPGDTINLGVGTYAVDRCSVSKPYNSAAILVRKDPIAGPGDVVIGQGTAYDHLFDFDGGLHLKLSKLVLRGGVSNTIIARNMTLELE